MNAQHFMLLVLLALAMGTLSLQLNDDEKHRELNSIQYCVADCKEFDMVQVHTDKGCYCIDQRLHDVPLWEPQTPSEERRRLSGGRVQPQ